MSKSIFEPIINMYDNSVKEADEKGYVGAFKEASEEFFSNISSGEYTVRGKNVKFTAESIEYLDGYFIFGTGTNSHVEFKIKECPGWKFAIWWNPPKEGEDKNTLKGTFFVQYEAAIDKFKPSYSAYTVELSTLVHGSPTGVYNVYDALEIMKFIKDEPYLAFTKDLCSYDYNTHYLTRAEAKKIYKDWHKTEKRQVKFDKQYTKAKIKYITKYCSKMYKNFRIYDLGECFHARYQPMADFDGLPPFKKPGCYDLFSIFEEDVEKKLEEGLRKLEKKYERKARKWGVWDFSDVCNDILLCDPNKVEEDENE